MMKLLLFFRSFGVSLKIVKCHSVKFENIITKIIPIVKAMQNNLDSNLRDVLYVN